MHCAIIRDLLPLYIDDCAAEETVAAVCAHLVDCPSCRAQYAAMTALQEGVSDEPLPAAPTAFRRLNERKAAILQSVLLLLSFVVITVGVALEARTGSNHLLNSVWAYNVVVPATGFMLSLVNWYFVKLYTSRRRFVLWTVLITLSLTVAAFLFTAWHYALPFEVWGSALVGLYGFCVCNTVIGCVLSSVFAARYAVLVGKE